MVPKNGANHGDILSRIAGNFQFGGLCRWLYDIRRGRQQIPNRNRHPLRQATPLYPAGDDPFRIQPKLLEEKMNAMLNIEKLIPAWQTLRATAPISHIESENDYELATQFLNDLLDIVRDDSDHPLYSLVSVVGDLIEAYEIDHEPV